MVEMAGKIQVLPEKIAQSIAAGEVVERPASVVKELMENAIDAGSTDIVVELKAGGLQLVRVQDNGEGIEAEDVPVALQRYATSKIRTEGDLFALRTLGFRGEALPSIASVSKLILKTRTARALSGVRAVCEGGELKQIGEIGLPVGTEVEVQDLFYNIPVKRKFMKSIRSELHHVLNHFLKFGLAYPAISFKLVHDGRVLQDLLKTKTSLARMEAVLGREIYQHLLPVEWEAGDIRLSGFAGDPSVLRTNGEGITLYVNQRIIKDRVIHRAVMEGYRRVIPDGKFPVVVLFITVPPSAVDVNVHPTKAEVKFRDADRVFQAVSGALRVLHDPGGAAMPGESVGRDGDLPRTEQRPFFSASVAPLPFGREGWKGEGALGSRVQESSQLEWEREGVAPIRILGQVRGTFLVCEGEQGLIVVDQHAAHERILFEKLKKEVETKSFPVVTLLLPLILEVTAEEAFLLSSSLAAFHSVGFEIDPVGEKTFAIRSTPSGVDGEAAQGMVREILGELSVSKREGKGTETLHAMLVTLSCHTAIRANHPLKNEEIEHLLKNLSSYPAFATCPHGRPIFFFLTWSELNKQFKRTS
jgi:DNA mismatch repair protein MutL